MMTPNQRLATRRILRYEVPVDDAWHEIELRGGKPLHVAARRRDVVEFWAHHDESLPVTETRRFIVVGTGHPLPSVPTHYHGTALAGELVWHLLEDMTGRIVFYADPS